MQTLKSADEWSSYFATASDDTVRCPMWHYPPVARAALIHERRRRFGVVDDTE